MTTANSNNGTSLAVREFAPDLAPRMVLSLSDMRDNLRELEEFKRDIMIPDIDYGVIPGTPKPTLLKPGAEKLSLAFGLAPTFESANRIEDWERGFFYYEERSILTSRRSGQVVASANGSANSREPRYRWRKADRVCPNCNMPAIIKGKEQYGGGWLCFDKKGGCKSKFADNDQRITGQVVGNIENPEPFELTNTILKMAQKRALVAAVLIATGGSGIWTQDVEDMPSVSGDRVVDTTGRYIPTTERDVDDAPRPAARTAPKPQSARQAAAQQTLKATTTRCSVCERMVENESLLRDAVKRFNVPFCIAHMNEALEQGKSPADKEAEAPL